MCCGTQGLSLAGDLGGLAHKPQRRAAVAFPA